jgi:hypothetical protein
MEITPEQYQRITYGLPLQRGNVSLTNLRSSMGLSCKCHGTELEVRGLPKRFGNWHTINRWTKNGVLDRVFEKFCVIVIVDNMMTTSRHSGDTHYESYRICFEWNRRPRPFPIMNCRKVSELSSIDDNKTNR